MELEEYSIEDVNILRMSCIKFRELMIQNAGLCPFSRSPIIAGYSHLVFRCRFMPEDPIEVILTNNYVLKMNTSHKAVAFIQYESQHLGYVPIRHAGTAEGEKRLLGIAVDWCMSDPEERVYIFFTHVENVIQAIWIIPFTKARKCVKCSVTIRNTWPH